MINDLVDQTILSVQVGSPFHNYEACLERDLSLSVFTAVVSNITMTNAEHIHCSKVSPPPPRKQGIEVHAAGNVIEIIACFSCSQVIDYKFEAQRIMTSSPAEPGRIDERKYIIKSVSASGACGEATYLLDFNPFRPKTPLPEFHGHHRKGHVLNFKNMSLLIFSVANSISYEALKSDVPGVAFSAETDTNLISTKIIAIATNFYRHRDFIEENPKLSPRKRSAQNDISKTHIQRILAENKFIAFKPKIIPTLEVGDDARRLDFCLEIGARLTVDIALKAYAQRISFMKHILDDEQKLDILLDIQDNPHKPTRQVAAAPMVMLMLNTFFWPKLDEENLEYRKKAYFQQDGCLAHSSIQVRSWNNLREVIGIATFAPSMYPLGDLYSLLDFSLLKAVLEVRFFNWFRTSVAFALTASTLSNLVPFGVTVSNKPGSMVAYN
ncbi:hypothetical protein NQ318_014360 [Aromia moschata]|uniref:Uncharacterized protein n=1 Tax=Aromia moschata TaxID=1265417 RepID=A0AAV8YZ48_9CUCU|nr:hypothetical protein NQ318_014360 [Aromia moschata]